MERAELASLLGGSGSAVGESAAAPQIVSESEASRFMEKFGAAVGAGGPVFLADPSWGPSERAVMNAQLQLLGGRAQPPNSRGWLMIPSGGTSGGLKFARHDEETIAAAVQGFCRHFELERVNAIGVLPLHHVSGLMAWMRCALTGGEYRPCDWKQIEAGTLPERADGDWVVSLVPTQLQRLLASRSTVDWLRGFRAIFLGGGPAWPALLDTAAAAKLPIALSYGMTEIAAMVTAQRPVEFLAGDRSSGRPLPHATIAIDGSGVVSIEGDSVFRGYWPDWRDAREFTTEDLGAIDERGGLHVLGRRDAMIITGGKKVSPADVEAVLRASGEFDDVAVLGVPDPEWGQAVIACYPAGREPNLARAIAQLANHQRPKRFIAVVDWPRNAQGKLNRAALLALLVPM